MSGRWTYRRGWQVAPVQGVADGEFPDQVAGVVVVAVSLEGGGEKGAAVAETPAVDGRGEEGAGEVGVGKGGCGGGGRVGRLGRDKVAAQESEERRRVEDAESAEEGVAGDDAAEGDAGHGGAG